MSEKQLSGLVKCEKNFSSNFAFGANVKQKRFGNNETEVPGPGEYNSVGTVLVREQNRPNASYKSQSKRSGEAQLKQTPGVGDYNLSEHLSVSNKAV